MTEYKRVAIKLSGESLGRINRRRTSQAAQTIAAIHASGVAQAVVLGGGNFFRAEDGREWGMDPFEADVAGMIATALNAQLLQGTLRAMGVPTHIFSRGPASSVGTPYSREDVLEALDTGHVVLVAGGMGIPGISTDVPAVHAAIDMGAEAVIMAKHGVDGVFSADPQLNPDAEFLPQVTASEALTQRLSIMDAAALDIALKHGVQIHVINAKDPANIQYVIAGKEIGSVVLPF